MELLITKLIIALVYGGLIAYTYYYSLKKNINIEMLLTLLIMPIVVAMIIHTIGSNVAGAFSLAGIFSIVRFRSNQASFRDIVYILFCVAAGLAAATSFYLEGTMFIVIVGLILIIFGKYTMRHKVAELSITIAEDMQHISDIELVLKKYCVSYQIESVKTKDLGSLFEYRFNLLLKEKADQKACIDELRIVNSNLAIKMTF